MDNLIICAEIARHESEIANLNDRLAAAVIADDVELAYNLRRHIEHRQYLINTLAKRIIADKDDTPTD